MIVRRTREAILIGNTIVTCNYNNSIVMIRLEISIVISCLIKRMRGTISTPIFLLSLNHNNFHFQQLMMSTLTIISSHSSSFTVLFFILLSSLIIISLLLV